MKKKKYLSFALILDIFGMLMNAGYMLYSFYKGVEPSVNSSIFFCLFALSADIEIVATRIKMLEEKLNEKSR